MNAGRTRHWYVFWACFLIAFAAIVLISQAAPINLIAYVTYSLLDSSGNPLPDGSMVMIFGSWDEYNDGPVAPYGGDDPLIADSTQGDDIFLGWVRIGQPSYFGSNGTFYTANQITFDDTMVRYMYLRFFDTTDYPVTGYVGWGTSTVFGYTSAFGQAEVDFVGNYVASMTNNFVIIPEPSTAHLLLIFAGLVAGMHAASRKNQSAQRGRRTVPSGVNEAKDETGCLIE